MKNISFILLSLVILFSACKTDNPTKKSQVSQKNESSSNSLVSIPSWAKDASIYQVDLSKYTKEGTVNAFAKNMPRLKAMGIEIIQFTPLATNQAVKTGDSDNSLFDLKYGTEADWINFVQRAHAMNMAVILEAKDENQDRLKTLVRQYKMDGFVFNNSNTYRTELLEANDSLLFITSNDDYSLVNNGMYHGYMGNDLFRLFKEIAAGNKNANDLHSLIMNKNENNKSGFIIPYVSSSKSYQSDGPVDAYAGNATGALTVLSLTLGGIPMIYGGQEEPTTTKEDNFQLNKFSKHRLFSTILNTRKRNKAMQTDSDQIELIRTGESEHIYSFMKEKDGHKFSVMVNLSNEKQQIKLTKSVVGMTNIFSADRVEMGQATIKSFAPWEFWVASNK